MNGVGIMELAVIGAVLLLFMGPKQMASLLRSCVKAWFRLKKYSEKVREELLSIPEFEKMIAEIRHEVYGDEETPKRE